MGHFHDTDDVKLFKDMKELAPTEFKAWLELDKIVGREDGKIPANTASSSHSRWRTSRSASTVSMRTPKAPRSRSDARGDRRNDLLAAALRAGGGRTARSLSSSTIVLSASPTLL